jgi:hypothetical protein
MAISCVTKNASWRAVERRTSRRSTGATADIGPRLGDFVVPLLSRPGLAAIPDIRPVPAIVIVHAACVLFRDIGPVLATTIAKAVPDRFLGKETPFGLEMAIFRVVL